MEPKFKHITDARTREIVESDPRTIRPCFIRRAALDALQHAEVDLGDPDVHNAGERMELAEAAVGEADPVRQHGLVRRFWSI